MTRVKVAQLVKKMGGGDRFFENILN